MDTGIVRDGWLLKSPPENNFCRAVNLSSLRPKWRKRWFILKHSGQLPGQYVLEYFTDASCKKLKGRIDLDQCDRVDSGLTFTNRKHNYRFMFDIRTPKRIYYLVAENEMDMNKWVDCICSVCGLKIEVEEEEEVVAPVESTVVAVSPRTLNTTPPAQASVPSRSATNLTLVSSESSPYIPISECITGKPIALNLKGSTKSSDNLNLVMLPMRRHSSEMRDLLSNDEFYDHPRQHCIAVSQNNQRNGHELYRVPPVPPTLSKSEERADWGDSPFGDDDSLPLCPPRVNWNTYPHNVLSDKPFDTSTYDTPTKSGETSVPCFMVLDPASKSSQFKIKGHKYVRCDKPKEIDESVKDVTNNSATEGAIDPPPRPPKPPFLDKRKYENMDPDLATQNGACLYDVPPLTSSAISVNQVSKPRSVQGEVFSFLKEEMHSIGDLSPSTKVPLVSSSTPQPPRDNTLDDMYDFPRSRVESRTLPSKSAQKSSRKARQHAYSNAPPGLFNTKENIMNYEYRPSLMSGENCTDAAESDLSQEPDSPSSPPGATGGGGMYANLPASPASAEEPTDPTDPPPRINRGLKPKKKALEGMDSSASVSFNLAPPPASKMATKYNTIIGKHRAAPSPTPMNGLTSQPPAIPYRPSDHSDDELSNCSSRRNSANEEQGKHWIPPAPRKVGGEIQYLDLDLDSESGLQIPRSPDRSSAAASSSSSSTVYKTVDFMKTKVFNEMRVNVEETYRKSQ